MLFLLVLAVILFVLGIFTVKLLWWAALAVAVVWLISMFMERRGVRS